MSMMTTCPFCSENNPKQTAKCRYCQAELLSRVEGAIEPESDPDKTLPKDSVTDPEYSTSITHAVDTGLVKLAKFVAASLALFSVIGLFYLGVKLVGVASELASAKEQVRTTEQQLLQVKNALGDKQLALDAQEKKIDRLQVKTDSIWSRVEQTYNRIQHRANKSEQPMIGLEGASTPVIVPQVAYELADFTHGIGKLWPTGSIIDIAFLEGTKEQRDAVKLAAVRWSAHANLIFNFKASTQRSDIRITFKSNSGNWSTIGTDAKRVVKSAATMNFDPSLRAIPSSKAVLRQFGYAIGLLEEHQNPSSNIVWDYGAAHEKLSNTPKAWSSEVIDLFLLGTWAADAFPNGKPYDRNSIMHESISADMTLNNVSIEGGLEISEGDKQWVNLLYP